VMGAEIAGGHDRPPPPDGAQHHPTGRAPVRTSN
jgi:hypothetical protein